MSSPYTKSQKRKNEDEDWKSFMFNIKKGVEEDKVKEQKVDDSVKTFRKQEQAIEYLESDIFDSLLHKHIFSEEITNTGQREFIVSTYKGFFEKYIKQIDKHYYELIREGDLCNLYFDIEFEKEFNDKLANSEEDQEKLIKLIIDIVSKEILLKYNIKTSVEDVVDLDSSNKKKFSRHLIWHIPNACFQNNIQVGIFVKNILDNIEKEKQDNLEYRNLLYVNNNKQQIQSVIDKGVYTKNRNFRIYLSSKYGKDTCLTVSKYNQYKFRQQETDNNKTFNIFLDSLVTNIDIDKMKLVISNIDSDNNSNTTPTKTKNQQTSLNTSPLSKSIKSTFIKSVDDYIRALINSPPRGGQDGYIRSIIETPFKVMYSIGQNKWCANINREHKGNHINLVLDLKNYTVYQTCLDPECKSFKSDPIQLPNNIILEINPNYKDNNNDTSNNSNKQDNDKSNRNTNSNNNNNKQDEDDFDFGEY